VEDGRIERTQDGARIKVLATHPAIFKHVADDFFPDPSTWEVPMSPELVCLVGVDEEGDFGFGVFMPRTWTCYEGHLGFLPRSYGPKALEAFKQMLNWIWAWTNASRVIGEICQENRRAIKFAVRAGFSQYGVNPKSTLRGGVLKDTVCLGVTRP
jgi:hypothetical protein